MNLITIEQAMAHCKADPADEALVAVYASAAEKLCAKSANRNLYKDQTEFDAAVAALPAKMTTVYANHSSAILAAGALDTDNKATATFIADEALQIAELDMEYTVGGMVAGDDVIAAVLLTTGHFYRNREEVTTGQGAAAVQLPMGADAIMARYFKVG